MQSLEHKDILEILRKAIRENFRVLLVGRPGVGKTSLILKAARLEKIKGDEVAVLTAPLIDPFTDLIGIPIPKNGEMTYARPPFFKKAKLIFIDEINRAPPKTTNAILELVQFGTLCGEKIPNLQAILMAGNEPEDGLLADPFEHALIDRVDVLIKMPYSPDESYFVKKFGVSVATKLIEWWSKDLNEAQRGRVSPRRLEKIGSNYARGIDPEMSDITPIIQDAKVFLPWDTLRTRMSEKYVSASEFSKDPSKFTGKIKEDAELSNHLMMSLSAMNHDEIYGVRNLILEMRPENLQSVKSNSQLYRKIQFSIESKGGPRECDKFLDSVTKAIGG